jgi:hypothetical protein
MTSFRPTQIEQYVVEARLNRFLGANTYDRVFLGFEVVEIVDDELRAWSPSEYCAAVIDTFITQRESPGSRKAYSIGRFGKSAFSRVG